MDLDFGRDFNQREYWKYDIQVKMGILKVLQEIRNALDENPFEEPPPPEELAKEDYHETIARQLKE